MLKLKNAFFTLLLLLIANCGISQINCMTNIQGRKTISLNGEWQYIVDWFGRGNYLKVYRDTLPTDKTKFVEYAFDKQTLKVPGDWNSQDPKLYYYEGSVWLKKEFTYKKTNTKRTFLNFGAVNYQCDVYLNSKLIGSHEGGFTPFEFEVSNLIVEGNNKLIVKVNNQRKEDGIPGTSYDWWNYGGITREVSLIETPTTFIKDYTIQLQKGSSSQINASIELDGIEKQQKVTISIPELGISESVITNKVGLVNVSLPAKLQLWNPENPKLYSVTIASPADKISEKIGFRNISVEGKNILLNGNKIFLKGINLHEEIPEEQRRATSEADARKLLSAAKELGCNLVRLAHYPQNEYIVRMAEQMGLMVWEEIPIWQGVNFKSPTIQSKTTTMLEEMIKRDKNRCGIITWSISNETAKGEYRNIVLKNLAIKCKLLDDTRLVSSAFDGVKYEDTSISFNDSLGTYLDLIGLNIYMGWYKPWPKKAGNTHFNSIFEKPMIISEYGGESKYGNHGSDSIAGLWNEEYQEKLYKDNILMFRQNPSLSGVCPWLLADFKSPARLNLKYQEGFNRKGLLSDKWKKKKAWYVMQDYYK